mgnify:CR=1 FL=1
MAFFLLCLNWEANCLFLSLSILKTTPGNLAADFRGVSLGALSFRIEKDGAYLTITFFLLTM